MRKQSNSRSFISLFFDGIVLSAIVFAVVSCQISFGPGSPKAALEAFHKAVQKKDVAAVRKTLSRRVNERIDLVAKSNPAPAYQPEMLVETMHKYLSPQMPATRGEQTGGNKGSLFVDTLFTNSANKRSWKTVVFVKEDWSWKIDDDIVFSAGNTPE